MSGEPTPSGNMFDRFAPEQTAVIPPDASGEMQCRTASEIEKDRFARLYPEQRAKIPPRYSAELSLRSTRDIIGEERHRQQSPLSRVPAWAEKQIRRFFVWK